MSRFTPRLDKQLHFAPTADGQHPPEPVSDKSQNIPDDLAIFGLCAAEHAEASHAEMDLLATDDQRGELLEDESESGNRLL